MAQTASQLASIQSLLRLKSPSNVQALPSKRSLDVVSGMDDFAPDPDSPELKMAQEGIARKTGMGFSREALRGDIMGKVKQVLGLQQIEHQQEMEKAVVPEQIRGEYGVKQAETGAKALADRLKFSQDAIGQRQEANQAAIMDRLNVTQGAQNARQEDAQAFKAGNVNPAAITAIANERKAIAAAQAKNAPNALMKMFGRSNPYDAQLETFDNTLGYAQKILREHPNASAEEALAAMGQQPSPDELGQIQKFLLLLRGH